ncbi:hypothetical protein [Arenimonas caeni]|jgi:hypothetical protein|uniref:Uncharacterized protein n=1 Tax=Arenimonas caeni TaxID=2058085 RepID=A0A2P6M6Q0_9GAMM|nr:hypothetical protein [Arenimonas caeni]PRH81678.1 hypothetical protein C6N40_11375 [Arenimonas caeni]
MRLFLRLIAIVIAVVVAAVLFFSRERWSDSSPPAPEPVAAAPAVDPAVELPALLAVGTTTPVPPAGPLPPLDAPLAQVAEELERRAAAGEPGAACRLAYELSACRWSSGDHETHVRWLRRKTQELDRLEAQKNSAAITRFRSEFDRDLARREQRLAERNERCAGYTELDPGVMAQRWYQAARLGSLSARRIWAGGDALPPDGLLASTGELALYRATATDMAWQLVREGDLPTTLRVAHALAGLHSSRYGLLAQALPEDRAMALALYRRAHLALDGNDSRGAGALRKQIAEELDLLGELSTADQRAEAERRALEFADWSPVEASDRWLPRMASGHGFPIGAHVCHREAGETVPELEQAESQAR